MMASASFGFDGDKGDEIKPLEEGLDACKSGAQQELPVFFNGKRDQYIFQGLSFFGDLQFRIAAFQLELMVDIDIFAVQQRVVGDLFFTEDQDAAGPQVIKKPVDKLLSPERPDELEGVIEEKGPGIRLIQVGDVLGHKGNLVLFGEHLGLHPGLMEHGRRVVDAGELQPLVRQQPSQLQQGGAGGAAQVDDRVVVAEKNVEEPGCPFDDLLVKRNGAVEHVIEYLHHLFGEDKILLDLVDGKKGVFGSGWHGGNKEIKRDRIVLID